MNYPEKEILVIRKIELQLVPCAIFYVFDIDLKLVRQCIISLLTSLLLLRAYKLLMNIYAPIICRSHIVGVYSA